MYQSTKISVESRISAIGVPAVSDWPTCARPVETIPAIGAQGLARESAARQRAFHHRLAAAFSDPRVAGASCNIANDFGVSLVDRRKRCQVGKRISGQHLSVQLRMLSKFYRT
jgi:hypothetical protein